jgi:hypothetical protein
MTTRQLASLVEGHGEVEALPILLGRLAQRLAPQARVEILPPYRLPRGKMLQRPDELDRALNMLARRTQPHGGILVLLDADDDCPAQQGPKLLKLAQAARPDRKIEVVLANREFEAWFLAAASSLAGQLGLPNDLSPPPNPEGLRNAKGWLSQRMPLGYSETADQPVFVRHMDLDQACAAPSFDKLLRSVASLLR